MTWTSPFIEVGFWKFMSSESTGGEIHEQLGRVERDGRLTVQTLRGLGRSSDSAVAGSSIERGSGVLGSVDSSLSVATSVLSHVVFVA